MKVSILALGALASAGWVFPAAENNQHGHPAPPHSSFIPSTPDWLSSEAAKSSPARRPCHGQHNGGPPSGLGAAFHSVRIWLNDHNLFGHRPLRSPIPFARTPSSSPPRDYNIPEWVLAQSSEITTQVDWYDAIFTDEPPFPVGAEQMRERILHMLKSAEGDRLPTMIQGQVKVMTYGQGSTSTRVYYPGHGREDRGGRGGLISPQMAEALHQTAIQQGHSPRPLAAMMSGKIGTFPPSTPARPLRTVFAATPQEASDILEVSRNGEAVRVLLPNGQEMRLAELPSGRREGFAGHGDERPGGGLHGKGGWHHRRPQTFSGRAMRNLRPAESLALAFVLGAGLGSILHMVFMLTLLLTRRIRYGRMSKEERRAKRAERRAQRQARRGGEGTVRLEGEDVLCVLRAPEPAVEGDGALCVLRAPAGDEQQEGLPGYEEDEALAAKLSQDKA